MNDDSTKNKSGQQGSDTARGSNLTDADRAKGGRNSGGGQKGNDNSSSDRSRDDQGRFE